MKVSPLQMGALGAVALSLLGCASDPLKTTGLLGAAQGKDPMTAQAVPAGTAAPLPTDVEGALRQAQNARKSGDFQGAAKILSQLVLVSADDPRILGEYSKTLIGLGRSDDAIAFLERALEFAPQDWSLYSAQGVALDQKGDYGGARKAYERALAIKPGDPTVLSNAALSRMQAGDLAGAEELLLQAAQTGSEYARIASNLALVRSLRTANAQTSSPSQPTHATAAIVAPAAPPPANAPAIEDATAAVRPALNQSTVITALPSAAPAFGPSAIERLKSDPSVRMQSVPKDAKAGPVASKAVAADGTGVSAMAAGALALRPSLAEGHPAQQVSAQDK